MQHAGARKLREDDYAQGRPARPNLQLVEGERRTVVITGQPMPPAAAGRWPRSRSRPGPTGSPSGPSCSRLFMVFVAVATANAAV